MPDHDNIEIAYAQKPELLAKIRKAVSQHPTLNELFQEIAHHQFRTWTEKVSENPLEDDPHALKKRKRNDGSQEVTNGTNGHTDIEDVNVATIEDVSFSMPQRKKMRLGFTSHGDPSKGSSDFLVWTADTKTGSVVKTPISAFAHILCLVVPEKPQKTFNYCFIPKPNSTQEAIVFTLADLPMKDCHVSADYVQSHPELSNDRVFSDLLTTVLSYHDLEIVRPNARQFTSAFPEVQRKKESAYHVKANIGTKDGFLYFLPTGIFFGFKKPLRFIPLGDIESTSILNAVSRTFTLAISYREEGKDDTQTVEFDQIDNAEHPGINTYIQENDIQDGSFAENRKAKILKKDKSGQQNGEKVEDDGRTELEKAQQQMEDDEDDEEDDEDFQDDDEDDGGSGSETEDEEYTKGKGRDLVGEELGSEAEDVSDDEEEEQEEGDDLDGDEDMEDGDEDEAADEQAQPQEKKLTERPSPAIKQQGTFVPDKFNEPDPDDDDQL